jgi:hypothetical protein
MDRLGWYGDQIARFLDYLLTVAHEFGRSV